MDIKKQNETLMASYTICTKEDKRILRNYCEIMPCLNFQICSVTNFSARTALSKHMHIDSFEFVYMFRGKQYYTIDDADQVVSAGELVVSAPNVCHTSGLNPQGKSQFYYITVGKDLFLELFQTVSGASQQVLSWLYEYAAAVSKVYKMKKAQRIAQVCESLIELHGPCDPYHLLRVRTAMSELILLTLDSILAVQTDSQTDPDAIKRAKTYIDTHVSENPTVDQLAMHSNYSRSAFCKQEIAEHLSFSSTRYFADVFKRYTTLTPAKYQKIQNTVLEKDR